MASNFFFNSTNQPGKPPTTISKEGLMYNPRIGQGAPGQMATDGRGYTREVRPQELVENRLNGLLSKDNPYLTGARSRSQAHSNARGLGNSSIAAGNAEAAAIDAAMPIAQSDADTYRSAAGQNLDVMTQNLMQDRQIGNELIMDRNRNNMTMAGINAQERMNTAGIAGQLHRQRENLAYSGEQAGLDRVHDFARTHQAFQFQDQMATNQTFRDDWMSNQDYNRGLNMMYASTQMNTMRDLFTMAGADAWNNPQVANPEAFNGFINFMADQFPQIFGGLLDSSFEGDF